MVFSKKPKSDSKPPKEKLLQSIHFLDVAAFQESTLSIQIDVFKKNRATLNPFSGRESALHVQITNSGENELNDLFIEAFTCDGLQLVDPGALFGTGRRHVRLPTLRPKKSVTYKLALRVHPNFSSGLMTLRVKSATWQSGSGEYSTQVGLKAD